MMNELRVARISFDGEELIVDFTDAKRLAIPLVHFPRLRAATSAQRDNWSLIGRGRGVHWETVDEDLSVENLLTAYSRSKSSDYAPTRA
jgi:hypothetical protein